MDQPPSKTMMKYSKNSSQEYLLALLCMKRHCHSPFSCKYNKPARQTERESTKSWLKNDRSILYERTDTRRERERENRSVSQPRNKTIRFVRLRPRCRYHCASPSTSYTVLSYPLASTTNHTHFAFCLRLVWKKDVAGLPHKIRPQKIGSSSGTRLQPLIYCTTSYNSTIFSSTTKARYQYLVCLTQLQRRLRLLAHHPP